MERKSLDVDEFRHISGKVGLELVFSGDHKSHVSLTPDRDVAMYWDPDSITLTIYLGEYEAKELYWDLVEFIPQLRHDRR